MKKNYVKNTLVEVENHYAETVIMDKETGEVFIGTAKCSPTDKFDFEYGYEISNHRANIKRAQSEIAYNKYEIKKLKLQIAELERQNTKCEIEIAHREKQLGWLTK